MSKNLQAGVVGASGYSGIELLRLLSGHPHIDVSVATSRKLVAQPVEQAYPVLRGRMGGLVFSDSEPTSLAATNDVDVFFLALPHGVASEYARPLFDAGKVVIDLSADFRLSSAETY
ncbi:MAG: N-acetyl-gamma-glutamyl-phosphate reductase, partial [Opitutae bacterium]